LTLSGTCVGAKLRVSLSNRKTINPDYDLHFTDESKSASASLVVPFSLGVEGAGPAEFTAAMWVQFDTAGETGTYFTLYSVE
jgi:hypothetical protein